MGAREECVRARWKPVIVALGLALCGVAVSAAAVLAGQKWGAW
jgi:hypothetical protein